jgi:hypothetical protein
MSLRARFTPDQPVRAAVRKGAAGASEGSGRKPSGQFEVRRQEERAIARCGTCGAELDDAAERFCAGDRCRRVFMNQPEALLRAGCQEAGNDVADGVLQREAGDPGALRR